MSDEYEMNLPREWNSQALGDYYLVYQEAAMQTASKYFTLWWQVVVQSRGKHYAAVLWLLNMLGKLLGERRCSSSKSENWTFDWDW